MSNYQCHINANTAFILSELFASTSVHVTHQVVKIIKSQQLTAGQAVPEGEDAWQKCWVLNWLDVHASQKGCFDSDCISASWGRQCFTSQFHQQIHSCTYQTLASTRISKTHWPLTDTQHRHLCVEEGKLWGKERRKHSTICRKLYNLELKNQNSQLREEINTRRRMGYFW